MTEIKWRWCLHCERCYKVGEHRKGDSDACPYDDCNGSIFMDGWPWEQIRQNHPEYPAEPVRGQAYPMY